MWAPGKDVIIQDGAIVCLLDFEHAYPLVRESAGFLESPFDSGRPHLQFLKVEDDKGLVGFVRRWGPIFLTPEHIAAGKSILALSRYWLTHRYLRRIVDLLSSFQSGSREVEGIGGYLELKTDRLGFLEISAKIQSWQIPEDREYLVWLSGFVEAVHGLPKETDWIGVRTREEGQITKILETAHLAYVRRLMDVTISHCFEVTTFPQPIRPKRSGQRRTIIPRPKADQLERAMEYLILLDAWSGNSLHQCDECGRLFRSETRHRRRYCGTKCANRVSSREYKRAIRAKQKRDRTRRKPQ